MLIETLGSKLLFNVLYGKEISRRRGDTDTKMRYNFGRMNDNFKNILANLVKQFE